ncbi:hypothetical protein [Flavobacterium sp. N3904]|uniref:hypothetical protein n=1 Tax=Flavobacterium sp. N3904 TaxID=2986835 RepID=UPI0022259FF4|nr:hypothetical protein [Flavobacterium sp. N3904]
MRKIFVIPIVFSVFLLNVAGMCSSDDDNSSTTGSNGIKTQVITTASSGTWKVTLFEENGVNETTNYTGYNFTFGSANVLTATNGTNSYTGTWSISDSNSNDDSLNDLHFNISFSAPKDFADLSDDWDIMERTDTRIKLKDVSGGNGGTDYLTLEKN